LCFLSLGLFIEAGLHRILRLGEKRGMLPNSVLLIMQSKVLSRAPSTLFKKTHQEREGQMKAKRTIEIAGVIFALAVGAWSQSTTASSSDLQNQITALQQQAALEKAKQDIATAQQGQAEAEAAAFKARLGSIDTSNLPKGDVSVDGKVAIEANYLAYAAAESAADRIVALLGNSVCRQNLAFFTGKDQDAVQAYLVFKQQLSAVRDSLKNKGFLDPVLLERVPSSVLPEPSGDMAKIYKLKPLPQQGGGSHNFDLTQSVAGIGPVAEGTAAINAVIGLVSLFKVDTTFNGVTVPSDDVALQALVTASVSRKCGTTVRVFHPTFAYSTVGDSDLLNTMQDLSQTADPFNQRVDSLNQFVGKPLSDAATSLGKQRDRLAAIKSELASIAQQLKGHLTYAERAKLLKQQSDDTQERQKITDQIRSDAASGILDASGNLDDVIQKLLARYQDDLLLVQQRSFDLKNAAARVTDLIARVSKADGSGVAPIQSILRAERMENGLKNDAYLLVTKIISVGGNNISKKNIFWSTISFSGGIVAEYLLNDSSGAVVASGTVECYGGRVKEANLQNAGLDDAKRISCTPRNIVEEQAQQASTNHGTSTTPTGAQ
jgi:hypothetical protein